MASHTRVTGKGVSVTRHWQQGRANYDVIPELRGVRLDEYRAPNTQQARTMMDT